MIDLLGIQAMSEFMALALLPRFFNAATGANGHSHINVKITAKGPFRIANVKKEKKKSFSP